MNGYQDIIGHHRQIDQLKRAQQAGRVAHAYLFSGPEGIGKEKVAKAKKDKAAKAKKDKK